MSCSNCGNSGCGGCGCGRVNASQVILNPVPIGVRPCSPLSNTCGGSQPASPTPFYECAPQCQESHCQEIVNNYFSAAICTQYAATVPDCGENVSIYFQGVKVLPVGTYLWNQSIGYLEVTAFNSQTGLATLTNHCNEGNAAVGTNIPACTCFVASDPPNTCECENGPFLAEDFTAPDVDNCTTITVTSVEGIIVGGQISVADGIYTVDSLGEANSVVICNNGEGVTPGTVVHARNEAGELQYPILIVATNPCTNDTVESGNVLVCESGIQTVLESNDDGAVLMSFNGESPNLVRFAFPGLVGESTSTDSENLTGILPNTTAYTTVITLNINNSHPSVAMKVLVTVQLSSGLTISSGSDPELEYGIEGQQDGGGYSSIASYFSAALEMSTSTNPIVSAGGNYVYEVPPGDSTVINIRGFFSNHNNVGQNLAAILTKLYVSYIGVSI